MPRPLRLVDLVCGQRHLPISRPAAGSRLAGAGGPAARRDRRPVSVSPGRSRQAEPAGERGAHRDGAGRRAPRVLRRVRGGGAEQRGRGLRLVSSSSRRAVGPGSLGQNFLIDRNILDVIERLASLSGEDVVLEIGGGLGVLSARLAARSGWLHVVEVDERLLGDLRGALAQHSNVTLHGVDALSLDLPALAPAPSKVVANLPYS